MGKSILAALIFAGLLAEGVERVAWATTSKIIKSSTIGAVEADAPETPHVVLLDPASARQSGFD